MNGAELFGGDNRIAVVEAHAAEFFRFGNPQQTKVAGLAENLVDRKAPGLFPFINVWIDLVFDELADGAAQCFVFRVKIIFIVLLGIRGGQKRLTPKLLGCNVRMSASWQISSR